MGRVRAEFPSLAMIVLYYKGLFMKALLESLRPGERDWELAQAIDPVRLPAHIAIIMDGNGRWAGRRFLPRVAGHKAGVGPVRTTVETCARMGVKVLTLYAFSVENWKRPRHEVETLWRLLRFYLNHELPDLAAQRYPAAGDRPHGRPARRKCGANWTPRSRPPPPTAACG